MRALIPLSAEKLGGPFVEAEPEVLAQRERTTVIRIKDLPPEITWFEEYEMLYAQIQHDGETLKVIRKATEDEIKRFRIPIWIQDVEIPKCCGRPMFFIGQIDDNVICTEAPVDAKLWWHDAASFYVFTCPFCLGVKAVGQQF